MSRRTNSRIDSQVLQQHVQDGQIVKQGDLLFTLDDREIQGLIARDQAQLAKDNATFAQAAADLGRKQELIAKGLRRNSSWIRQLQLSRRPSRRSRQMGRCWRLTA